MKEEQVELRKQFQRPLLVGLALAIFGELMIFLIFGVLLYPEGNILSKFLWTVLFCGIGMGSALGVFISLLVVGRLAGKAAILACTIISTITLGFGCNLLCFNLDQHFHYFGGQQSPQFFIINGIIMAVIGGVLSGWLLFTPSGSKLLSRIGI
jgi:hypothetical protein|tara:strand:+ start:14515 stop:14973 length:459 start_codon:yes stop_codon:yes gene_type:complete